MSIAHVIRYYTNVLLTLLQMHAVVSLVLLQWSQRLKSAKKEVVRQEMKLAARAARRQRQKELTDGVETRRLGVIRYQEPSVDLKLSSEQATCLRQLTVQLDRSL